MVGPGAKSQPGSGERSEERKSTCRVCQTLFAQWLNMVYTNRGKAQKLLLRGEHPYAHDSSDTS